MKFLPVVLGGSLFAFAFAQGCGDDTGTGGSGASSSSEGGAGAAQPGCGDGIADPDLGEECDDENVSDDDACLNDCTRARCGDGVVRAGFEDCDDSNSDDTDACPTTCITASCGDGFVQAGVEDCDDGNEDDDDACKSDCTPGVGCGNGEVDAGEECDDGDPDNTDVCTNLCLNATCGDGFGQAGVEECDDGNDVNDDLCRNDCTATPITNFDCPGTAVPVNTGMPQTLGGDMAMSTNAYQGSCGGNGAEVVYEIQAQADGLLRLELLGDTNVDGVLYVRSQCDGAASEIACRDMTLSGATEAIYFDVIQGGTYYVFADSYSDTSQGEFLLGADLLTTVPADDCGANEGEIMVTLNNTTTVVGDTSFAAPNRTGTGSCNSPSTKDLVYKVTPPVNGKMFVAVAPDPAYDASILIRSPSCTLIASQIACAESEGPGGTEVANVNVTAGTTYHIIVDGYMMSSGPFSMDVTLTPP